MIKIWFDGMQSNMSNISEILFSSDWVRAILTQVIIWRENWRRLFLAEYFLFSGDLPQADNLTDGERCIMVKLT